MRSKGIVHSHIRLWLQGLCENCEYSLLGLPVNEVDQTVKCPECAHINVRVPLPLTREDVFEIYEK